MKKLKLRNKIAGTKERVTKIGLSIYIAIISVMCMSFTVFAGGEGDQALQEVTTKINTVKVLVFGIIGVVGGVVAGFNFLKAAKGHKNGDDRQFDQGVTGVIVGIVMTLFGTIMTALGWGTT